MSKVNYTYGILTGGVVPATSVWYRNCRGITYAGTKQQAAVQNLWGAGRSSEAIGCGADVIIRILQCSETFSKYINEYDKLNTYDTELVFTANDIPKDSLSFDELLTWADNNQYTSTDYPVRSAQPSIIRVTNSLFNVLTMKG